MYSQWGVVEKTIAHRKRGCVFLSLNLRTISSFKSNLRTNIVYQWIENKERTNQSHKFPIEHSWVANTHYFKNYTSPVSLFKSFKWWQKLRQASRWIIKKLNYLIVFSAICVCYLCVCLYVSLNRWSKNCNIVIPLDKPRCFCGKQ